MKFLKFGDSKNVMVFLHGWGADKNSFLWLKDYFVDEWSMIFVDFDGFGDAPDPEEAMFVGDYAKKLKEIIDKFSPEKLVLVGHSFGGRVSIKFSFLYQNIYEKLALVLVDSAGVLPRRNLLYHWKVFRFKRLKKKALGNKKLEAKLEKFGSKEVEAAFSGKPNHIDISLIYFPKINSFRGIDELQFEVQYYK